MDPLKSPSLSTAMQRGMTCKCPACGKGKIFSSYLKVAPACAVCGEEFHHHRADDMPAYYVIMIVGHIIVLAATTVEVAYRPDYWIHIALWGPLTLLLTLGLLPPVKGAIVALQWQLGMHGFAKAKQVRELAT